MKLSWSALKVGGIGFIALTLSLVSQQTAGAQQRYNFRTVPSQYTRPNRTLSNYYPYAAVPGNPLSPTNALNNQIYNYYQNRANNQSEHGHGHSRQEPQPAGSPERLRLRRPLWWLRLRQRLRQPLWLRQLWCP